MNVIVMGPNAKGKGWFNEGRVKDAVDDWPSVVVIGSKINNGGGTGVEVRIGCLSSRGTGGSTAVVGVIGATVGSCAEGGLMPVGAAVVVASAFLFFLLSRLFLLFPVFSLSPPSFFFIEAFSSFPTSSCCCCLTDSASRASRGKVLAFIIFDRFGYKVAMMQKR